AGGTHRRACGWLRAVRGKAGPTGRAGAGAGRVVRSGRRATAADLHGSCAGRAAAGPLPASTVVVADLGAATGGGSGAHGGRAGQPDRVGRRADRGGPMV